MSEQDTTVDHAPEASSAEEAARTGKGRPEVPGGKEQAVGGSAPDDSAADESPADDSAADDVAPRGDEEPAAAGGPREADSPRQDAEVERLEQEGEVAADFLERLLDIADLDGDIDVDVDGDRASVAIVDSEEGRVPRRLVGPDGRVLEALQELTRLAVQASTGNRSRLMLDVAGHRAARREELVRLARTAIERVRSTGEAEELESMTAFERKVVHDEVLAAGLTSESEGEEPRRYVVVLPAGGAQDGPEDGLEDGREAAEAESRHEA